MQPSLKTKTLSNIVGTIYAKDVSKAVEATVHVEDHFA